jgi:hypothetical protein
LRQTDKAIQTTLQSAASKHPNAGNWPKQFDDANALLDHLDQRSRSLKDATDAAVKQGLRNVETLLEQTIATFTPPREHRFEEDQVGEDRRVEPDLEDATAIAPESASSQVSSAVDWLASVKDKTLELLRGTVSEQTVEKRNNPTPTATRTSSLTTPVTVRRESLSIDSQVSWWSEWFARQNAAAPTARPAAQVEPAAPTESDGLARSLQRFEEIQALAPGQALAQLIGTLRGILHDLDRAKSESWVPADPAGQYGQIVADACLALAIHENVNRQIRALFAPPNISA